MIKSIEDFEKYATGEVTYWIEQIYAAGHQAGYERHIQECQSERGAIGCESVLGANGDPTCSQPAEKGVGRPCTQDSNGAVEREGICRNCGRPVVCGPYKDCNCDSWNT